MKEKIINLIISISDDYYRIMNMLIGFNVLLIICFFILTTAHLGLTLIFGLLPICIFFASKDKYSVDDKKWEKFVKKARTAVLLFFFNFALYGVFAMVSMVASTGGASYSAMRPIGLFVLFIVFMIFFMAVRGDKYPYFIQSIRESPFLEKLGIDLEASNMKPGDVILCKKEDFDSPVIIPRKDRYLHMLILGPTGCGKTSQTIIPMINQDVQNLNAGITVLEPKGDLAEKIYAMCQYYGRPAIYFNPILDSCPSFNPLFGKEEDVIENMTTTIRMLAPDSSTFFQNMGEQLMRNALKVLKRTKGNHATMIDLYRLIANTRQSRPMVQELITKTADPEEMAENADIAQYFMSDYFNDKSKTFEHCSGVRSQISKIVSNKFLRKVLNPQNGKSDIDWDAHLANKGVICITTAQGSLRDLGSFLGYLLILSFQSSVFKRPGNENTRPDHFLYIDEFQKYANPGFADMLTQGRSYRVASHLATQNRALIGMGSGQEGKDFIELVSTNARNIVLYPGANYTDAKYYSDQFGEITERKLQTGISQAQFNPLYGIKPIGYANKSIRESEEDVARFSPTDIMQKPFGMITYSIIKNNSVQIPAVGRIEYINADLNKKLDVMIEENHALMTLGYNPNECRDLNNHGVLLPEFQDKIEEIIAEASDENKGGCLSMSQLDESMKNGVDISVDDEAVELSPDDIPQEITKEEVSQSSQIPKSANIPPHVQVDSDSNSSTSLDDFEDAML